MALNVLLVDPSEEWLGSAAEFLKENMYTVSSVANGKDAQLALYNEKFFAVILNWEVQNHSGSQVLKFVKTNHPSQRVVIILENDKRIESGELSVEKLKKLGATEVAIKPFETSYLAELLEGHQSLGDLMTSLPRREGQSDEVEVSESDDDFTSVPIDTFFSSKAMLFDIYIKLSSGRYIKILHAGDNFSKDRLDKYKNEKGVKVLHFHKKDRRKFVQFNNYIAKKLISNKNVPNELKMGQMLNVTDKYLEEVYTVGMKPQIIEQGKEICNNVYNFISKQNDLHTLLRSYQDLDPSAYTHSFLVTVFCTSIIKQFEWQSQTTIETTALACLFHDIGKLKLPKEMITMRPQDMNDEQMELYKKHPEFGAEIVDGNRTINNSVKQIIIQHHEFFDGNGFPYGKRGSKILTLANIVCLADDFAHIMIDQKLKPVEALKKMLISKEQIARYNSIIVENFINVFVDPEKIVKENNLPSNSRMVSKKAS